MEINDKLFENIIIIGKSDDSPIFDEIENQEAKMSENKDLYDAFEKINKVLDTPSRYGEIQTIAPAIDVNKGIIKIDGVAKHDVKANRQDTNRVEDGHPEMAFTNSIIDMFANDLATVVPDNLEVEYEILDDTIQKMGKTRFTVIISRKA